MASNPTLPNQNESINGDDNGNNKANVEPQQQVEPKRGKKWFRNHRYKERKRGRRLKKIADEATNSNGPPPSLKVTNMKGEATLPEVLNMDQSSGLKGHLENLEMQQRSPCSPSTIRIPTEDMLAEVHKVVLQFSFFLLLYYAIEIFILLLSYMFEFVDDKLFLLGCSAGEMKDTQNGEMASVSADSLTCAEANAMGGGPWPSDSKRRRSSMPDASKKAKVLASSEGVSMETDSTLPLTSTANLASQAPIWAPEYFVGGNPRIGPLRADQSAFTEEVAVGLMYGSRLPADKAYFAQCKDAWDLYTHVAKCLAGVIGAATELHNRATSQGPSTVETDSRVIKLEMELASRNSDLEEASKRIKKQAEKITNQARNLEGLASNYQYVKTKLAEKDDQCKIVNKKYVDECERNKVLCNHYSQLQREKKEQEDSHFAEIALLTKEKLPEIQSSECVANGMGKEGDQKAIQGGCSREVMDKATGACIVFSGIDPLNTAGIIKEEHTTLPQLM